MGLYEKMFNVMNESEAIEKSMTVGSGANSYKAVSEAAMLNAIKPLFKKHKLIIFPTDGEIKDHVMVWEKAGYKDSPGTNTLRAVTELKVYYTIMDIETGEKQQLVGFGNGADPQDKGAGKAFTYSFKNCLSKTFMLFSGEDTDNNHSDDISSSESIDKPKHSKPNQTPSPSQNKPITAQQEPKANPIVIKAKYKAVHGNDKNYDSWIAEEKKTKSLAEIETELTKQLANKGK